MIEKMLKVSLVCQEKDRETTLDALRDLSIMHVKPGEFTPSRKLAEVQRERESMARMVNLLSGYEKVGQGSRAEEGLSAGNVVKRLRELSAASAKATEEIENLSRHEANLEPWGDFDPGLVKTIRSQGLDVRLCRAVPGQMPKLPQSAIRVIRETKEAVYFLVLSQTPIEQELPEVFLPDDGTLNQVRADLKQARTQWEQSEAEIASFLDCRNTLGAGIEQLQEEEEFLLGIEPAQ